MAYDEDLANRIRELVGMEPGLTEKKMFGGLAFLIGGNMAVAASGQGGLMLRVDPNETAKLLAKPHARPLEMRGRQMEGWLRVDDEGVPYRPHAGARDQVPRERNQDEQGASREPGGGSEKRTIAGGEQRKDAVIAEYGCV